MRVQAIVPELMVSDVERSIEFYSAMFGFNLASRAPESGKPLWAEIRNGTLALMLQDRAEMLAEMPVLAGRPVGGTGLLVLQTTRDAVREFARLHPTAMAKVMPMRETDYGTTEAAVADPDGYIVLLAGRG